jgi:cell division protein FtsW
MNSPRRGTPDFLLLFLTFLLVGFGLVMVFSASSVVAVASSKFNNNAWYFTERQIVWAVLGIFSMFVIMNIPSDFLRKWFKPFFIVVVIMLVMVLFTEKVNGARSWFGIGIGSRSIGVQPTEFAKLAVILYLAALISKKGDKFRDFHKGLLPVLLIVGLVAGLIMLQPDLGSCMILIICALTVIVTGGANLKHLFTAGAILGGIASLFLGGYLLALHASGGEYGYRMHRILSFLDPWADPLDSGYNLIQSWYALAHGGITGAGFGQSIQKLHYLPYPYNDFIFAVIGEELGFIGILLFLLVYIAFLWRGLIISLRSPHTFGTLAGAGVVGMIASQALINIGGVTGAIPITGVTLPLISYGGTSLLVTLASIGILLSISRDTHREHQTKKNGARLSA